jgi:hypothetical protein
MRLLFLLCLTLMAASPLFTPARAADAAVTMQGVARAASLMQAIGDICGPAGANAALAAKYFKSFADAGREAYGPKFDKVLQRESARRAAETQAAGSEGWCAQQKRQQDRLGDASLFAPGK